MLEFWWLTVIKIAQAVRQTRNVGNTSKVSTSCKPQVRLRIRLIWSLETRDDSLPSSAVFFDFFFLISPSQNWRFWSTQNNSSLTLRHLAARADWLSEFILLSSSLCINVDFSRIASSPSYIIVANSRKRATTNFASKVLPNVHLPPRTSPSAARLIIPSSSAYL